MTRRLLLVRHGRIAPGLVGRFIGATDAALDVSGEQQARSLAHRVQRLQPERCFCSPLTRCRQTALAVVPHQSLQFDDRLREIDFGQWEKRAWEEVVRDDPESAARWTAFAPDFAFPGGERLDQFIERVRAAAEGLCRNEAETVLAVTHGGVIRVMLCLLLGLELQKHVVFDVGYASLAVIDVLDRGNRLRTLEQVE